MGLSKLEDKLKIMGYEIIKASDNIRCAVKGAEVAVYDKEDNKIYNNKDLKKKRVVIINKDKSRSLMGITVTSGYERKDITITEDGRAYESSVYNFVENDKYIIYVKEDNNLHIINKESKSELEVSLEEEADCIGRIIVNFKEEKVVAVGEVRILDAYGSGDDYETGTLVDLKSGDKKKVVGVNDTSRSIDIRADKKWIYNIRANVTMKDHHSFRERKYSWRTGEIIGGQPKKMWEDTEDTEETDEIIVDTIQCSLLEEIYYNNGEAQ